MRQSGIEVAFARQQPERSKRFQSITNRDEKRNRQRIASHQIASKGTNENAGPVFSATKDQRRKRQATGWPDYRHDPVGRIKIQHDFGDDGIGQRQSSLSSEIRPMEAGGGSRDHGSNQNRGYTEGLQRLSMTIQEYCNRSRPENF